MYWIVIVSVAEKILQQYDGEHLCVFSVCIVTSYYDLNTVLFNLWSWLLVITYKTMLTFWSLLAQWQKEFPTYWINANHIFLLKLLQWCYFEYYKFICQISEVVFIKNKKVDIYVFTIIGKEIKFMTNIESGRKEDRKRSNFIV